MLDQFISRTYSNFSEESYQAVVREWHELRETEAIKEFYRTEVFPRSCYRMRLHTPRDRVELLFVPVGTQPYAPIMACLGVPARQTVLLHSGRTRKHAQEVVDAFRGDSDRVFQTVQIEEFDPADISQKVQSNFDVLGQPTDVVCDVTGGTKVMTATLAGMAAINGWDQVYVQSQYDQGYGSHSERLQDVPSVFETMGGWSKGLARRLAALGHFGEASRLLTQAMETSLASGELARDQQHYRMADAYRRGRLSKVKSGAPALARKLGRPLVADARAVLQEGPEAGFWYWVCRTLLDEDQALACCGAMLNLGQRCRPDQLRQRLKTLAAEHRRDWRLKDWKVIDDLLGSGFRREVTANEPN